MTDTTNAAAGTTNSGSGENATAGAPAPAADASLLAGQGGAPNAQGNAPAGDKGAAGSNVEGAKGDAPAAPENYEFKMPEGVELDGKAAEEFTAIAKELKLSQADAQRIADVAAKMQQKQAETHVEMVKGWADQCKTDKEFGGDNLPQNLAVARKAIEAFGSPALRELLNNTGMGNHPEVVRFAYKAGKAISEDTFVPSGTRVPTPSASLEKRLYPNMN